MKRIILTISYLIFLIVTMDVVLTRINPAITIYNTTVIAIKTAIVVLAWYFIDSTFKANKS